MSPKKNIRKVIPKKPENPFKVPEGYFDDVPKRVMERIRSEEQERIRLEEKDEIRSEEQKQIGSEAQDPRRKKIYLQPYLSLAAAISGVALVVYIVLQSVMGNQGDETNPYDIATLDRAGIIQDESILADAYTEEEVASTYSEWDEDAIVYLASNEVDLLDLIDTN